MQLITVSQRSKGLVLEMIAGDYAKCSLSRGFEAATYDGNESIGTTQAREIGLVLNETPFQLHIPSFPPNIGCHPT